MAYTVNLMAAAERETLIQKACASHKGTWDFYDFRDDRYELKVVRLPIDLPIYRMANFRTFTEQREYIVKNGLKKAYFASGQELESVQQLQHGLLAKLAVKGHKESVVPVQDVLEDQGQREPLLISATGVVVNGNRRLAAMRELGWEHADFMVLPADATAADILDIEASLQGKPETRLEYDWIGDGELIDALVTAGRSTTQIAKKLHRSDSDIKNVLQAITEADLYLKDWAKAEGEYSRVEDAEQFFKDLPKQLAGKSEELAQASRVVAWILFDNKEDLPGRLYNYNPAFGRLSEDVLDRLADELGISTVVQPGDDEETPEDGDFDIDVDEVDGEPSYEDLIEALREEDNREDTVPVIIDAAQAAIEFEKGQKSGEAALKALSQANGKMVSVDLSKASPATYGNIGKQLDAIEGHCKTLRSKLSDLE